ncbi:MAG: translocation/assembly module TamB domain-containing protein [Flavisolibacter sp.]
MQTEWGQNWLASQVTKRLSRDLQSRISIQKVKVGLFSFNKMDLEGVMVEDQKRDTLLYAGKFQVRITDWFFFRDKAVLKYIGLENAVIHINRTDSVWNYQFLASYFSSTDTSQKKESGIQFDLKKIVFKNVSFIKKDAWEGNSIEARVGSLNLNADEISIAKKNIAISSLSLTDPYFSILDYPGNNKNSAAAINDTVQKNKEPDWNFKFQTVTINNGRFRLDKDSLRATVPYFDGSHIDFSMINGSFKEVGWSNDTLHGNINLSTRERSGLVVRSLKAKTTIQPKAMIFDQLHLETNKSVIGNYYSMKYADISSMDNFIHAVTMEANFTKASISSDDIAFFAPEVKSWKKEIKIDGRVKGTVDALSAPNLTVWAGSNTFIRGSLSLVGLPKINETLINIEAKELNTTYSDAVQFIPSIRNINKPDLSKLRYIKFTGTYTGFINDFVTFGTLQTNLGTLVTDLNMKFPSNDIPVYSGTISTAGFQLGKFIDAPDLGLVDFHGKINGRGFKWSTLNMNIDGIIHHIQYGNYTYQNITAKGKLSNQQFNGDFLIKDPNADLHMTGLIDLKESIPLFDVVADITHADLKALQLTSENIELSGKFNLNMKASSLSNMVGTARISNATLLNNGKQLSFDSLSVSSFYTNGVKTLKANSNEFSGTITGDFDLQSLPDAFTVFLSRYYPAYIKPPHNVHPQNFSFDITTGNIEDYIKLIDRRLSGFSNSHIAGSLNMSANNMTINADVPQFSYKQYTFSDVKIKGSGDLNKLVLNGEATNAQVGDSLLFPQTNFTIQARNDTSNVTINTTANQAINQANVSAQVRTFSDGISLQFKPSSFVLNGKTWSIEQGGELNFRRNHILNGQVVLKESNQEIKMWTELSSIGNWNDLHISLQNINLGDITPLLVKKERIEGLLSGDAIIEDPQDKFNVSARLHTEELRIDNDSIGKTDATLAYNSKTGLLTGKGNNLNTDHHVAFDLGLNLKDTTDNNTDRITILPTNFELKFLNRFLNGLFSNIQGYVTGKLDIIGKGDNQKFLARASLKDASLKVDFTQVTYTIDNTEIELRKDTIDLNNIRIRDRFGNTAVLKGYISHKAFQNMNYDIVVQTESRQMELLNTTYYQNQQFFGRAMGSGLFALVGPESDMLMNIEVKASETDSSYITIPPSRSHESGLANFMLEKKYGREMSSSDIEGLGSNLKYQVHIEANPKVNVEVILDQLTGDAIKGRGTGDIDISAGTNIPLSINGRYEIYDGNYLFTFQSFLKKPFVFKKNGNNSIVWDGDPYGATIHLEAIYTAEKVSFAPLENSLLTNQTRSGYRGDVNVIATLTGNLFHPNFNFKLELPSNNQLSTSPDVSFAFQQIEKNQNELNKQVTTLIVFNSFAPYENVSTAGFNPLGEFTYSTISGLFFGEINKRLNQLFSKVLRSNNLTLNFTGSLYNRDLLDPNSKGVFNINQSNLSVSLGKSLFNERANFTIGGTFDVPLATTQDIQQTIRLFPDVSLDIILNKTGSIKATFFYKENLDYMTGASNLSTKRYGTSISYGREFDTIGELFSRKKARKKKTVPTIEASSSQ